MIRELTRYDFLLYHADLDVFLERLRELGVVDITTTSWVATDDQRALMEQAQMYGKVSRALKSVSVVTPVADAAVVSSDSTFAGSFLAGSAGGSISASGSGVKFADAQQAMEAYQNATRELEDLAVRIQKARTDAGELEVWGDFNAEMVKRLRDECGVNLRFFETDPKTYRQQWEDDYPIEVVHESSTHVYFVVADTAASLPTGVSSAFSGVKAVAFPSQVVELRAPEFSAADRLDDVERFTRREAECQAVIADVAAASDLIEGEYLRLSDKLEFTKVAESGVRYADGAVVALEGWSFVEDTKRIVDFADSSAVVCWHEAAKAAQNPPIQLKNNFFARLFEPIGSLYMLPKYGELDMTPYFAPFFMIFFGMCFGDLGYGLLFLLVVTVFWKKIPEKFRGYAWLIIFLSISTIFFGAITGNFCGLELAKQPMFAKFAPYFIPNNDMFNVAIGLGAVQIFFGLILRIFNRAKKGGGAVYGLSALGWVLLIAFSGVAYLEPVPWFGFTTVPFYCALGVAGVLIFLLNSPGKNPFINIGAGLYNCYEMATGVVGDLVSYVRLFAIGLTGAIIAQVFNALSVGLSGDIPVVSVIIMIIILLVGHAINLFVSVLGAFVHPVRLTFVEFFKNAEFEGGGRPFIPFARFKSKN